ncbi:MAG TPA: SAM-dependent methyltransferase [Trebonia sp.]|jgi:SAM-dependent methyltransferase|nr:SAM-dependent methyltransferase [Trebonia sp.]
MSREPNLAGLDTTVAHPARMQNYVLGGKDHFAADREAAEKRLEVMPDWRTSARESRHFLGRAVGYLTAEAGIRQFLDIGPGLPSAGAAHEVAQVIAPDARVAYVDCDPMVVTHARALLNDGQGICAEGDVADPESILAEIGGPGGLDFGQPVAVLLLAVLHFVPASADPRRIIRTLADALAPGSYLVISHLTKDFDPGRVTRSMKVGDDIGIPVRSVTRDEFGGYFTGLDLLDPGIVLVSDWRRDVPGPPPRPEQINFYGGLARKPG